MRLYAHRVRVAPVGNFRNVFPTDMLRYDELVPYSSEDANKIERCFGPESRLIDSKNENEFIELWRRAPKNWTPTKERWASFLWRIVEHIII